MFVGAPAERHWQAPQCPEHSFTVEKGSFLWRGGSGLGVRGTSFSQGALSNWGIYNLLLAPSLVQPLLPFSSFLLQTGRTQGQIDHKFLSAWQPLLPRHGTPSLGFPPVLHLPIGEHSISLPYPLTLSFVQNPLKACFFPPHVHLSTAFHSLSGSEVANAGGEQANEQFPIKGLYTESLNGDLCYKS